MGIREGDLLETDPVATPGSDLLAVCYSSRFLRRLDVGHDDGDERPGTFPQIP